MIVPKHTEARQVLDSSDQALHPLVFSEWGTSRDSEVSSVEVKVWIIPVFSRFRVFYVSKGSLSVKVCKKAFLKIHGVSNGRLDRTLKAKQFTGGSPHCDKRGKHEPGNKTKKETIDKIKAHINCIPCYKSHYSRKDNPNRVSNSIPFS